MKQTEAEIIKEEPVRVNPNVIRIAILVIKYISQFVIFLGLLLPWCSGARLVSGAIILAWFSQQLNNLRK